MKLQTIIFALILLLFIPSVVYSENSDLASFFTRTEANTRLTQIRSSLTSFRNLSNLVYIKSNLKKDYKISTMDESKIPVKAQIKALMTGAELKKIGNQGWEIQNIGFANWPKYVEGYIEYMELENLQLKLQLAEKSKLGSDVIKKLSDSINKKEADIKKKYLGEENWTD